MSQQAKIKVNKNNFQTYLSCILLTNPLLITLIEEKF